MGQQRRTLAGLLLLALVAGAFVAGYGYGRSAVAAGVDADSQGFGLLREMLGHIRQSYLERQVDGSRLFHGAARGMVEALGDPYSRYLDPQAFKAVRDDYSGVVYGVGILIELKDDRPVVVQPIPETPAQRAGLRPGDRIIAVDGTDTERMSLEEIVSRIRGPSGTRVTLDIARPSRTFKVQLVRTRISNITVHGEQLLPQEQRARLRDAGVGYIRVRTFYETTAKEFNAELDRTIAGGAKGVVLDLRSNVGGLLHSPVAIADRFVPAGQPIVHTVDREGRRQTERATRRSKVSLPLVILVNEYTASAAEILAGALSDHEVATLVGVQTFGKGVIQSIIPLSRGAGATLTSGKYLTPDGRDIHKKGLPPAVPAGAKLEGRSEAEIAKIEATQFATAVNILKQRVSRR